METQVVFLPAFLRRTATCSAISLRTISQLYAGQLIGEFVVRVDKHKATYQGQVTEVSKDKIVVKSTDKFHLIEVKNILAIYLMEGGIEDE